MTAEDWLAKHQVPFGLFEKTLLWSLQDVNPLLIAQPRSFFVLAVKVLGPMRPDQAYEYKATFEIIITESEQQIPNLFVQAYDGLSLNTRELTKRLLCNIVDVASLLRLNYIMTRCLPSNTRGHIRAGFLPLRPSWDLIRFSLAEQAASASIAGNEPGAVNDIMNILKSCDPASMRRFVRNTGLRTEEGLLWPRTSQVLLSLTPYWQAIMDLKDVDTISMRNDFCCAQRG